MWPGMDLISKERDRLLQRTARVWAFGFALVSLACLLLPGSVPSTALVLSVPLYVLLLGAFFALGFSRSLVWVGLALLTGLAIIVIAGTDSLTESGSLAIIQLAAGSLAAVALVLTSNAIRVAVLVMAFLATLAATVASHLDDPAQALRTGGIVFVGWAIAVFVAIWVSAGVPQASKRIASIGRAHRAERQASELEAQRRQNARLLHDTVLATLTLLAHSGVGVKPEALRAQAADDARLLRQLRLGTAPGDNAPVGPGAPSSPDEAVLGTTLESVKQRFGRMGLKVSWHGTGQVLLPSDVLDAFLLALAECLENVRRHSGVTNAHVTITEDESTVRAMVTDAGVGFDLQDVDDAKLGFKESVVARLRDVGGNARLFSAPGAGTTVVLEVPRG